MDEALKRILERQKYKVVGEHSAAKLCHWVRQCLLKGRVCYKQVFYGIETHRCLQMTPTVNQCTQACLFCWRYQGAQDMPKKWDEPEVILEGLLQAQREMLSGYKGVEQTDMKLWREAQEPNQVAISLSGEPTLYPYLGDFIELCRQRGMTTFLVSNGTNPEVLENLSALPTQLYITVAAPTEEIYKRLCVPLRKENWKKLQQTLALLPTLNTRTVIRHTLVSGWNLGWEKEYARLIEHASPLFIEPKGYVFVGYSRQRMSLSNMPSHAAVKAFGERLAGELGYEVLCEKRDSRVVLLGRDPSAMKIKTP